MNLLLNSLRASLLVLGLLLAQSPAHAQPALMSFATIVPGYGYLDNSDYFVATGRMRTKAEAVEYCSNVGRRLPNRAEASDIFKTSILPSGQSKLSLVPQVDVDHQDGSFWTSETQSLFRCAVSLQVKLPGVDPGYEFEKICSSKTRRLTICVRH